MIPCRPQHLFFTPWPRSGIDPLRIGAGHRAQNPVFLHIFQGLIQIEAIPYPIASIWLDCFEMETLRNIQTAKNCLVWVSFVFAQNGKHWSCSTCLAMLHTAQFREGSYSFVVKHWVKSSKRVENARFFAHFGTKVHSSCQFPREIIILYQQNSKKTCVFAYFPGARSNRSNSYLWTLKNQLLLFERDLGGLQRPFQIEAGLSDNSGNCF